MNMKQRASRIDETIDQLFEQETGKEANQNVYPVATYAKNKFNIDMTRTAQIHLGVTMDGSVLIDSESLAYLDYCEKQLWIVTA
jgi:hypothetical protein